MSAPNRGGPYATQVFARLPCRMLKLWVIAIASLQYHYMTVLVENDEQILNIFSVDKILIECYIECTKTTNTLRKEEAI